MNLIDNFQNLVAQVPDLIQPLIVALAAAVPFIEGEGAAAIGIIGGIHPVITALAGIAGNFLCVALVVLIGAGARQAVVSRVGARGEGQVPEDGSRSSARREKFARAFARYGVPGVSLLGPLLIPTQFTAAMLAASGIGKARILIWQLIAIIGWTTVITLILTGVIAAIA